jgi:hypothetical protein
MLRTSSIWLLSGALALGLFTFDGTAQEQKKPSGDAPQAAAAGEDAPVAADGQENTEAAERARQRRRAQTTTNALLKFGDKNISLLAAILKTSGHDYKELPNVKEGEVVQLTRSQVIKLKSDLPLTIGDLTLKTENVAKGYAGVYGIWLKKTAAGWNFVFNQKPDVWGTMYDPAANVGEVPVEYSKLDPPNDAMKFEITQEGQGGALKILWGEHQWIAKFTIAH